MKFLLFTRENNIFDDILKDASLKNQYKTKIEYKENLILGFPEDDNFGKILSYIMLKYGDDMKDFHSIVPDRTPVPNVDYVPVRRDRNQQFLKFIYCHCQHIQQLLQMLAPKKRVVLLSSCRHFLT